jgi:hypothetical protein
MTTAPPHRRDDVPRRTWSPPTLKRLAAEASDGGLGPAGDATTPASGP